MRIRIALTLILALTLLVPAGFAQKVGLIGGGVPRVSDVEPPVEVPEGIVSDEDMLVLGTFTMPTDGSTNRGQGQITARNDGGTLRLYTTGRAFVAGGSESLLEITYPGIGGTASVVRDYGYVWGTLTTVTEADSKQIYSILWDDDINGTGEKGIIFTYGARYTSAYNPSIGVLIFDEDDDIVASYGPWGIQGVPSQSTKGYIVKVPADVYAVTGFRYFAGSHNTANNGSAAFGPFAQSFNLPDFSEPADTYSDFGITYAITGALKGPNLDYHDVNSRFLMQNAENYHIAVWDRYWDSAYYGLPDPNPYWPPNNPTQDGTGCNIPGSPISECGASIVPRNGSGHGDAYETSDADTISITTYVEGSAKRGILVMGSFAWTFDDVTYEGDGYNHWWYGPMNQGPSGKDPFGQAGGVTFGSIGDNTKTMANLLFVRDPASYIDVFNELITNPVDVVREKPMNELSYSVSAFPKYANKVQPPFMGGAAWDTVNNLLFVTLPDYAPAGCCGEIKPEVWVIQIDVD